jgi:hypothetical protein
VLHILAQVGLCGLLHLNEDHGRNLLRAERFSLALKLNCTCKGV